MLCAIAGVLIVIGALFWIIGWRSGAVRLLLLGIALAFLAPLLESSLLTVADQADEYTELLIVLAIIVLTFLAFLRYIFHKRALGRWFGEAPTSTKRRVDRR